jgi:hypothetical protein
VASSSGLGTRFGLVRYRWVAVKLALNVLLVSLVVIALRPGISEAADYGDALAAGRPVDPSSVSQLIFPPIVSTTALVFATVLAVYKPWGRLRRHSAR